MKAEDFKSVKEWLIWIEIDCLMHENKTATWERKREIVWQIIDLLEERRKC